MRSAHGGQAASPVLLAEFTETFTCENGHTAPAPAGLCPRCPVPVAWQRPPRVGRAPELDAVPAVVRAFVERFVLDRDTGVAPRWPHAFGYEQQKLGVVNHIPVCDTLAQLTAYFNGGSAQGSTHFGFGREQAGTLTWDRVGVPVAPVHQYMPIVGPCAPWAQGRIQTSALCPMPPSPTIRGMRQGEPNGAFISVENVARTGRDGVTAPQFNSNAMIRAYCAAFFGFEVSPLTQLWHSEIDQVTRCDDPGWEGALEDAMQSAARRLLVGDLSGMRGVVTEPAPRPAVDYRALYIAELQGSLAAARDDVMRAAVRERELTRKLETIRDT